MLLGLTESVTVAPDGFADWLQAFRLLQGPRSRAEHGEWIRDTKPNLAPDIRERFEWTSTIGAADVAASNRGSGTSDGADAHATDRRCGALPADDARHCPAVEHARPELGEFRGRA